MQSVDNDLQYVIESVDKDLQKYPHKITLLNPLKPERRTVYIIAINVNMLNDKTTPTFLKVCLHPF